VKDTLAAPLSWLDVRRLAAGLLSLPTSLILGGIVLWAIALRFFRLEHQSVWLDEAISYRVANMSPGAIISYSTDASHPPLYYLTLHYWLEVFGSSEGAMRALSAVLGVLAVLLIFKLGEALFGPRAGLFAALFAAMSPFWVWYSQEARMYSMSAFLGLLSANCLVRAMNTSKAGWWGGYVVATVALLYTNINGIWWLLAINAYFALSPWRSRTDLLGHLRTREARWWILAQVAACLLFVPWLPTLLTQAGEFSGEAAGGGADLKYLLYVIHSFNSYSFNFQPNLHNSVFGALSVLVAVTLVFLAHLRTPNEGGRRDLASAWLFVPVAASFLISQVRLVFLLRNLIVASIGFYLLLGHLAASTRNPRLVAAIVLSVLSLNVVSLGRDYFVERKEDWRPLVAHVEQQATPNDLILLAPAALERPFAYYSRRPELRRESFRSGSGSDLGIPMLTQGFDSVWLVVGEWHVQYSRRTRGREGELRAWFDANAALLELREYSGISLYHYKLQ
jgi:uncharacterized membrane protein